MASRSSQTVAAWCRDGLPMLAWTPQTTADNDASALCTATRHSEGRVGRGSDGAGDSLIIIVLG
eukprot:3716315-Alexandrium_andersonii.AAC.1